MEIELKDVLDGYIVDPDTCPALLVEIDDVSWCRAEPDVGIMSDYVDDWAEMWYIDDSRWENDCAGFVATLIGDGHIEGEASEIVKLLSDHVKEQVDEMEPGE